MAKGDDILKRLEAFSVSIIRICDSLPKTPTTTHVARQLLRSGTAAAPNYAEGRSGESTRDFIHKLGVALKELSESMVWLNTLNELRVIKDNSVENEMDECNQLSRILATSIKTASRRVPPVQR
jgi:four helix bundle protein